MKRFSYTCIFALILFFSFSKSSAQSNIIGNPIKIGNIEVAQYDFRKIPWVDANNSCINLGDGWRLPTIEELKILYQNREIIGNFKWDSYWSSTKGNIVIAWRLNFGDGMVYDRDNTDNTACVRAVRNLDYHSVNAKLEKTNKKSTKNSESEITYDEIENLIKNNSYRDITSAARDLMSKKPKLMDAVISEYQKQALSTGGNSKRSSGNLDIDISSNKPSNTQSQSNSNLGVCPRCQPYNSKGHRISDFNVSTRLYSNERYIQKPGYIVCKSCYGTGLMSQTGPKICNQCNGERFLKCSYCNGTGKKN